MVRGRKRKWDKPKICERCGERTHIFSIGLCRACYYRQYREIQERKCLQARLEKMVDAIKLLGDLPRERKRSSIELTIFEEYIWERQSCDSVAELARKTGETVESVEIAYERGMRFYLGTSNKYLVKLRTQEITKQ